MKAWKLDRLGGALSFEDVPIPDVRPGSVLVRMEASMLMSYLGAYVSGELTYYQTPSNPFTPVGNGVGVIEDVGRDVWSLRPGQRVFLSSLSASAEQVAEPTRVLLGVTSLNAESKAMQADWPDGVLADYALYPAAAVTPAENLSEIKSPRLAALLRCVVPYGGLLRGRLAVGETVIVNGASGSYGATAVLVALAMGAGTVVAVGRNVKALDAIAGAGGARVRPVVLTGDAQADSATLRAAAGGGAHLAFDMVGQARDANATLASLEALRRGGRLVLMGSVTTPLSLSYMQIVNNDLEIIGQFMYPPDATRRLSELVRLGLLDLGAIRPRVFPLSDLHKAMDAAAAAESLECVVVRPDSVS